MRWPGNWGAVSGIESFTEIVKFTGVNSVSNLDFPGNFHKEMTPAKDKSSNTAATLYDPTTWQLKSIQIASGVCWQ